MTSPPTSKLLLGDALEVLRTLPAESCHHVMTSPPYYGLRDYGIDGQIGFEETPEIYISKLVGIFQEVRRVLRDDGTIWVNMGDSYVANSQNQPHSNSFGKQRTNRPDESGGVVHAANAIGGRRAGLKPKDMIGVPWMLAFALRADGWYLRSDIIWNKPNPMPESVEDRPTKSHEYVFLLSKSQRYYYDAEAVKEPQNGNAHSKGKKLHPPIEDAGIGHVDWHKYTPNADVGGRNLRTVWTITTQQYAGAHFATFPEKLVEPCILAGTSEKGACPECGAPWERKTEIVATQNGNGPQETRTIGWEPTCQCDCQDTVPCVVLDPFSGSGTTGSVALSLGRSYIGIELNPKYDKLARERLNGTTLGLGIGFGELHTQEAGGEQ